MERTARQGYQLAVALDMETSTNRRSWQWLLGWLLPVAAISFAKLFSLADVEQRMLRAAPLLLSAVVLIAAFTDLRRRKIYNWLTYPAFVGALVINGIASNSTTQPGLPAFAFAPAPLLEPSWLGAVGWAQSWSAALTCFGLLLLAFTLSGGGAGDVKLAVVCGACLGMREGLLALAYCYLVAGAFHLALVIWKHGPWTLLVAGVRKIGWQLAPGYIAPPDELQQRLLEKPVPLGPFFACGCILVLLGVTP